MVNGPGLLGALLAHTTTKHTTEGTSAAKELRKEIFCVHAAGRTSAFQTFLSILIIHLTFLLIRQNFVSMGKFLELIGRIRIMCILVCIGRKTDGSENNVLSGEQ